MYSKINFFYTNLRLHRSVLEQPTMMLLQARLHLEYFLLVYLLVCLFQTVQPATGNSNKSVTVMADPYA
jgi:hypothetical protein